MKVLERTDQMFVSHGSLWSMFAAFHRTNSNPFFLSEIGLFVVMKGAVGAPLEGRGEKMIA